MTAPFLNFKILMTKAILFLILLFSFSLPLLSQKEDHHWLIGKGVNPNRMDTDTLFGGSSMNFNFDPVKIFHETKHEINMAPANASICDKDGNLIAYSNGQVIMNGENDFIEDTINYNFDVPQHCREWEHANAGNTQKAITIGMLSQQGVLILNVDEMFYCFYVTYDQCKNYYYRFTFSKFIINNSNPEGNLIYRDHVILNDTLISSIHAIRHGNGRDWWI